MADLGRAVTSPPGRATAEGRVLYHWPGKHGEGDIKVTFKGHAPSHPELLAMIWGICRSEDRYADGQGRKMLIRLIGEVCGAPTWEDAKPIIERARWSVENRRAA